MLDILIPTYNRASALAVTLTSLIGQSYKQFNVIISDQTEEADVMDNGEVKAVIRVLEAHNNRVEVLKHLPRQGMAEQRQFLLNQARSPYALFIDDDLILEPFVLEQMLKAIQEEKCGFVGSAVLGLSYIEDFRPHQEMIEFWEGPIQPEVVQPDSPEWQRYQLHNAANLMHVQQKLGLTSATTRKYHVAWVGGCALYDVAKLREVGGFGFWRNLPTTHCGEDVLAQLRVMARYGGCGLIPSGVYHQELPTTIPDRQINAPRVLI